MFLFIIFYPPRLIPYNQIILCKYFQRVNRRKMGIKYIKNTQK